jgi:thioredoxin 1
MSHQKSLNRIEPVLYSGGTVNTLNTGQRSNPKLLTLRSHLRVGVCTGLDQTNCTQPNGRVASLSVSDPVDFVNKLKESPVPVLVEFSTPWCSPCRAMDPILENIAKEYSGALVVAKIDADDTPTVAMSFGVQDLPTMLFAHKGEVLGRQVGAPGLSSLRSQVNRFLNGTAALGNANLA